MAPEFDNVAVTVDVRSKWQHLEPSSCPGCVRCFSIAQKDGELSDIFKELEKPLSFTADVVESLNIMLFLGCYEHLQTAWAIEMAWCFPFLNWIGGICVILKTCFYTYIHVRSVYYTCVYVYMCICVYVYMYICIYVYMYIYIYEYMNIYIYVYIYIHIYIHYIYMYIYIYIYIHIYIYMYM